MRRYRKLPKADTQSDLEASFRFYWKALAPGMPEPVPQYIFHPKRRWRLDFAFPEYKIGIELDGGSGGGFGRRIICHQCGAVVHAKKADGTLGRELRLSDPSHASGPLKDRDAEKSNALVILGWKLLRYTSNQLYRNPDEVIQEIAQLVHISMMAQKKHASRSNLTERELEIAAMISTGKTESEAAMLLGISQRTVTQHMSSVREKIGAVSTSNAIALLVSQGLIEVKNSAYQPAYSLEHK